jgi:recombination protein RecR
MEGETTAFYLFRKLNDTGVNVSAIARGVAIGDELQYADELTLANSILRRQPYEANLTR